MDNAKIIDQIVKFIQNKTTIFSVAEINEISQMLISLKPKPEEEKVVENKKK